jgi:hypothetical protein
LEEQNINNFMKKISLFMVVCLFSLSLFAQTEEKQTKEFNSVVSVSPFRLLTGLRIKYERVLTPKITYGGILTGYYGSYPGVQLAPIARYYFKEKAPEGFYAQVKIAAGFFQSSYSDVVLDSNGVPQNEYEDKKQSFTNFGAGIAAGYQLLWGKNNKWSIDINLGVKFVGNVPKPELYADDWISQSGVESAVDNTVWYFTGPGSIVDGLISIGYRF